MLNGSSGVTMIWNVAIFGAFLIVVAVLGLFFWQTLFASEVNSDRQEQTAVAQDQQQDGAEKPLGSGASPGDHNPTEQAIASYTKWLAVFTAFLVLATVALFI